MSSISAQHVSNLSKIEKDGGIMSTRVMKENTSGLAQKLDANKFSLPPLFSKRTIRTYTAVTPAIIHME
jgi:hypothetical protein